MQLEQNQDGCQRDTKVWRNFWNSSDRITKAQTSTPKDTSITWELDKRRPFHRYMSSSGDNDTDNDDVDYGRGQKRPMKYFSNS